MLDEEDRQAQVRQRAEETDEVLGLADVEARRRLVEHQQRRCAAQGPGQLHRPQVTERQAAGRGAQVAPEPDHAGQPGTPLGVGETPQARVEDVLTPGGVGGAAPEEQVVEHRQAPEEPGRLEGAAEAVAAPAGRRAVEPVAVEADLAAVGGEEAGQAVEERRLPSAVGADDPGDLGGAGGKVHAVEGVDAAEVDREVLHVEDLALLDGAAADGQQAVGQLVGQALPGRFEPGQLLLIEEERPAVAVAPVGLPNDPAPLGHEPAGPLPGGG